MLNHCQIVGEIAKELVRRLPATISQNVYPPGIELVAAIHDVGKVSPYFQAKLLRNITEGQPNAEKLLKQITDPSIEKQWGGHAGVSQVTVKAENVGRYVAEIVGQHHGFSPQVGARIATDEVFGGELWQALRRELLTELQRFFGCSWPDINTPQQARAIAGLVSVADWIGSGSFFENPQSDWKKSINKAVDNAGFVPPQIKSGLNFKALFGFSPRNIQQQFYQSITQPGVYILEAPMGVGKTEAALYAAYLALSQRAATGIYFALPTQLTSNKIQERVNQFLSTIIEVDDLHQKALLLHGSAWLAETEMGKDGKPGGSWFMQGKRGLLAPFAVGTIDQALMAVMNVRFGFVRAFGLVGKVVVLDEVHSYDTYTGTLLDELVLTLRELQCTVIILSATLTNERRAELIGREVVHFSYPLITASTSTQQVTEIPSAPPPEQRVILSQGSDKNAIEAVLQKAEEGQQVLWIENTVYEAQALFSILASRCAGMHVECGLLHSRFTKTERNSNESYWVSLYGKQSGEQRNKCGRILVGTQVLEQSLDIDADFLVTRFCPTDMLLQRLGRLWRHSSNDEIRPQGAKREAWFLRPTLAQAIENPDSAFGRTAFVYNPYILCRSQEVWDQLKEVKLPSQIRELIEATYEEREESELLSRWKNELVNGNRLKKRIGTTAMRGLAQIGLSSVGETLPESKATTRYGDQESVDVLLLRKISKSKEGVILVLMDGKTLHLPTGIKYRERAKWRALAAEISRQIVHVADFIAPDKVSRKSLSWLADYLYLGYPDEDCATQRVALVKYDDDLILADGRDASDKYHLSYNKRLGYQAIKRD